jgi:hypothetical protein
VGVNDTRVMTCEACGGDGGFESRPYGYSHITGAPLTNWTECADCDGSGWAEVRVGLITLDDIAGGPSHD